MSSPRVSIIIPVYNDPRGVELTLESLTNQETDTPHEILAVDNDSTDRTPRVIDKYAHRYENVHALAESDIQSSYAARNTGIERAAGDLLAFIDADMTVETDWLASIVASQREHGWDYAGCDMRMYAERETLTARYDMALRGFPVERYLCERDFCQTACLVTTREVFDSVGVFDERMRSHGDEEFGKRVADAGFDQQFVPEAVTYHPARSSLRNWLAKQTRIGRGAEELRRLHPEHSEASAPTRVRSWLPPHPGRFRERLADALDSPSPSETTAMYALDAASKWARAAGALAESR